MNDLIDRIAREQALTPSLRDEIRRTCGERGAKALAALDEGRVKRYLDFVVVEGSTAEYIVDEDFCTCGDFLFRGRHCWHLLAVRLAAAAGMVVPVASWYQERWKNAGTNKE